MGEDKGRVLFFPPLRSGGGARRAEGATGLPKQPPPSVLALMRFDIGIDGFGGGVDITGAFQFRFALGPEAFLVIG